MSNGRDRDKKLLLVVEDDMGLQKQLKWGLEQYELVFATDRETAIAQLRRYEPDVITLDLGLPPDPANASVGMQVLQEILQLQPESKVIVLTGNDDKVNAVNSIGLGAYDYCQKPMDLDTLGLILERAFLLRELEKENRRLAAIRVQNSPLQGVIAASEEMLEVCKLVERIAPANISALLLGESGTGKEVLAVAIHALSDRASQRFVAINCASIPENLLESELFGYEKGAFTGAVKQTPGKVETAHRGTLFLDEIGDMPMPLQSKLLRFLQERRFERLGGRQEIEVDVRIISATHQNLEEMTRDGRFREDLYYRLSEFVITIPPLRARPGDAILIARAFFNRYCDELGRPLKGFSEEACQAVEEYSWPGNVRQLENRVKRAVIMADGSQVTASDLGLSLGKAQDIWPLNLKQVRDIEEKRAIVRALGFTDNNISRASELLGITRPTLYALLEKHAIQCAR
ncbi:PEP-CTERM-box response regulator transcription factor [Marinobacterium sedimentorum]|uniref:PEP-CTERM-box response regulator transcription factor n=1 Tax=Marinobacterium sedimentorum TaxID=2927804 RepID=UPI0020C61CB9|nr:PEP-CTERM-box response regulator transcription factor [Marinobacterium sedimentorum]MCP8686805.1 PEP-CTERM-box response regulator transcription factor [Marinobacterium sedimentorum]